MIRDVLTRLASSQAFTAGTTASSDKYDLGATTPRRDIAAGEPMAIVISVVIAAAGSTDTTSFQAVSDEDSALGSPTIHESRTIANALLVAGAKVVLPLPQAPQNYERYLGARVVLGSGDTLTATIDIVPLNMVDSYKPYHRGYAID